MNKNNNKNFQKKLAALRKIYASRLPSKINDIIANWEALQMNWHEEKLREIYHLVHTLRGSAGTYGYPQLSAIAAQLENDVRHLLDIYPQQDKLETISKRMIELRVEVKGD